jgi:hypothetical protein
MLGIYSQRRAIVYNFDTALYSLRFKGTRNALVNPEVIVDLKKLPEDHPLRNTPLGEIKAEMRNIWQTRWQPVASWRVATATFNELDSVWTECAQWRINQ